MGITAGQAAGVVDAAFDVTIGELAAGRDVAIAGFGKFSVTQGAASEGAPAIWYAFGLQGGFVAPSGTYAELDTGATELAFAAYTLGDQDFPGGVRRAQLGAGPPPNVEIALVADDVDSAYAHALEAGCTALAEPKDKPQGQRVAWVRDPFGTLPELATPL